MPTQTKRNIYFEEDTSGKPLETNIEKRFKSWKGDPAKLEKDWKQTQRENNHLKNQIATLQKENALLTADKNSVKKDLSDEIKAHQRTRNEFQVRIDSQEAFINQLGGEVANSRRYEKTIRAETSKLEDKSKSSRGGLKSWSVNQIRKWVKDIEPFFNQVFLPETLLLVSEGFGALVYFKQDAIDWKVVYELERDKVKERDQTITDKDNRIVQLEETVRGSALIFQRQINIIDNLTQQLETEYNNQNIDSENYQDRIKELSRNRIDLEQRIQDLKDEEIKNKTLRDAEIANLRAELDKWTTTFAGKTPADIQTELNTPKGKVLTLAEEEAIREYNNVKAERDNRPNITLAEYENLKSFQSPDEVRELTEAIEKIKDEIIKALEQIIASKNAEIRKGRKSSIVIRKNWKRKRNHFTRTN